MRTLAKHSDCEREYAHIKKSQTLLLMQKNREIYKHIRARTQTKIRFPLGWKQRWQRIWQVNNFRLSVIWTTAEWINCTGRLRSLCSHTCSTNRNAIIYQRQLFTETTLFIYLFATHLQVSLELMTLGKLLLIFEKLTYRIYQHLKEMYDFHQWR